MKKLFLIIILFATISAAKSQSGSPRLFTLNDCIENALKQNPQIQSNEVQISAAETGVTKAYAGYLPTVTANAGYNANIIKDDNMPATSYSISANANYNIFDGFSREASIDLAKYNLDARKYSVVNQKQLILIDVYRQFFDILRKEQIVKTRSENLELGRRELERIQAQYAAGVIHNGPVYAQEAELGQREYELVSAQNDLNLSKAQMLILMGFSPDFNAEFASTGIPVEISKVEIESFRSANANLNQGIQSAMENRSELNLNKINLSAAGSQIDIAKSSRYPTVSAGLNWNFNENADYTNRTSVFSVSLSYPIFDAYRTRLNIEEAEVALKVKEYDKFILEQSVKNSVKSSLLTLESAEKQIEISERSIRSAKLNYETYKERFEVGTANITEYLDANSKYITAQINRINAVYYYLQAQKETLFAMGKLK